MYNHLFLISKFIASSSRKIKKNYMNNTMNSLLQQIVHICAAHFFPPITHHNHGPAPVLKPCFELVELSSGERLSGPAEYHQICFCQSIARNFIFITLLGSLKWKNGNTRLVRSDVQRKKVRFQNEVGEDQGY